MQASLPILKQHLLDTIAIFVHIQLTFLLIFEHISEHTLEKDHSVVVSAQKVLLRRQTFKIIFVLIQENDHMSACIVKKDLVRKYIYKNMFAILCHLLFSQQFVLLASIIIVIIILLCMYSKKDLVRKYVYLNVF